MQTPDATASGDDGGGVVRWTFFAAATGRTGNVSTPAAAAPVGPDAAGLEAAALDRLAIIAVAVRV